MITSKLYNPIHQIGVKSESRRNIFKNVQIMNQIQKMYHKMIYFFISEAKTILIFQKFLMVADLNELLKKYSKVTFVKCPLDFFKIVLKAHRSSSKANLYKYLRVPIEVEMKKPLKKYVFDK